MKAISIRQPWAWLIVNSYKDIENRDWTTRFRGRVLIHASKGMTKTEYSIAQDVADIIGVNVPVFDQLDRGGIVGAVDIVGCVTNSQSPWFSGKYGFVLRNAEVLPFRQYKGALGFFEVQP
jgi:hypothetical protein